ncbi:MAG: response regulator transcription factor [Planctomycetes bacterium]|nr:response regulator transcription factor [Planctomycetota bacterium]MCB9916917.1 response regulator transcription factor [Planctomycetota bacterium]
MRILLVEDDPVLRIGLCDNLEAEGYEVQTCQDGARAARFLAESSFDLVVLDLMLPKKSGLDVLRELRARDTMTPVLLLTAKADEADKVLGLELGADDYVTKPFGLRELLARVRACLRRGSRAERAEVAEHKARFCIGATLVDLEAYEFVRDGERTSLSPKEAGILELLWQSKERVVPRQRFLEELWGHRFVGNRSIDTHVLNLRKKLEADPANPEHLLTAHGVGYRLVGARDVGAERES